MKFKDCDPSVTVDMIRGILNKLGIQVREIWHDSGLDHCWSLSVCANNGVPSTNGKGVTKELARASAYGEFIERLQGGIFLYKYQSINRIPGMNPHAYAPDVKYMTVEELVQNGEWMDYLINTYKNAKLTREVLAEQCRVYACADDGKILTLPFYSLFEDKYVYLPMGFVDQIYATNGFCAGNTREEAWVHALSEILERNSSVKMLINGKAAPRIPDTVLKKFPTVTKILQQIKETDEFNVEVFDYSIGKGIPVVATRIISKKNHSYIMKVAADPILEIAVQRTLTEIFQGKNIRNVTGNHEGKILNEVSDFSITANVVNQLETGSGLYTADFFANELTCDSEPTEFTDHSKKNNKELFCFLINWFRQLGKPVYVRNFSFLGFPSYRFVIPGYSEALFVRLSEIVPEYAIADEESRVMRNLSSATDDELIWLQSYNNIIGGLISRYHQFGRLAGIPLAGSDNRLLACVMRSYTAYRLGQYDQAIHHIIPVIEKESTDCDVREYFFCVNTYLQLKNNKIAEDKIRAILKKFYYQKPVDQLFDQLDQGLTPYDCYLVHCDCISCVNCQYRKSCSLPEIKVMNQRIGEVYSTFTHGQDRKEFML